MKNKLSIGSERAVPPTGSCNLRWYRSTCWGRTENLSCRPGRSGKVYLHDLKGAEGQPVQMEQLVEDVKAHLSSNVCALTPSSHSGLLEASSLDLLSESLSPSYRCARHLPTPACLTSVSVCMQR